MPIALDGIRTCISGIRAHSASDCTTTTGTPPVSRNKHFRHSPVSSIVKQSCMKHSNSYLRDRDAKHLQGPPLSRTRCVCVCVCVCVSVCERDRELYVQYNLLSSKLLATMTSKYIIITLFIIIMVFFACNLVFTNCVDIHRR